MTGKSERIAVNLNGGPASGQQRLMDWPVADWPPPERLAFHDTEGGYYQRVSYSQLPAPDEHIVRGGVYKWVATGEALEPLTRRPGLPHEPPPIVDQRDEEITALRSTLTESIRRLKLAMRAAGPRRGVSYKDLQAVLVAGSTAPREWEKRAEKA